MSSEKTNKPVIPKTHPNLISRFFHRLAKYYNLTPYPKLISKRLVLREPRKSDITAYHQILSAPEISRYSDLPVNPTEKQSRRFLYSTASLHSRQSGIAWLICLRDNDLVIGSIRINKIEKKASCGLLAYEVHPDYWGQGYATEALAQVVDYAHDELKLNRLEAWSSVNNIASDNVLSKNGFNLEGLLREKVLIRGELMDINLFAHLAAINNNNA